MNENINIEIAEELIENEKYKDALEILRDLAEKDPNNGRIAYNLGRIALINYDSKSAYKFFKMAVKNGFENNLIYILLGDIYFDLDRYKDAQSMYEKSYEFVNDDIDSWLADSKLTMLFIKNKMYLNAEKIAKQLINNFPDNYQGYHFIVCIFVSKDMIKEAKEYIDSISEKFFGTAQYQMDKIDIARIEGNLNKVLDEISNDSAVMDVIPETILKYKFHQLLSEGNLDYFDILKDLIINHPDTDTMIALMLLCFAKKDYKECSDIAAILVDKNLSEINAYLVIYIQIFCLYNLLDGRPNDKFINWLNNSCEWCLNYAIQFGEETFDQVKNSLQEAINGVNQKITLYDQIQS